MMLAACRIVLVLVAVLGQQPSRDAPAQPRTGTAVIAGTVVTNDADPQPVRRARITLNGDIRTEGQVATSDDTGTFVFRAVPSGRYTLQANKPPFLPMNYGATRPDRPGTQVAVADGQTVSGLVIRMTHGAAIEGRVLDHNGEPMAGTAVTAMRNGYSPLTGDRALTTVANVVTDDRGVYRAFGLAPGEYVVAARPPAVAGDGRGGAPVPETRRLTAADVDRILRSGQALESGRATPGSPVSWSPVYYPGTPELASAARIILAAGDDQSGIDISMRLSPTSRISGLVTMPEGLSSQAVSITIIPADPQARVSANLGFVSSARPSADGHYTLVGVTPGSFIVNARTGAAAGARGAAQPGPAAVPMFWASSNVTVQGADLDVPLTLQPGIAVSGRVNLRTSSPITPEEIRVTRIERWPIRRRSHHQRRRHRPRPS
jgi:Carboxypeptidase regulatory-like domain